MKTYIDTSVLLKGYILEEDSDQALEIIQSDDRPVLLSHLLELELRTAIRNRYGRSEITTKQLHSALVSVENDIASGVLCRPEYDLAAVYRRAEKLSAKYAAKILGRSADIWHIAAAVECDCHGMASFDERQRKIAGQVGLKILP